MDVFNCGGFSSNFKLALCQEHIPILLRIYRVNSYALFSLKYSD